MATTEITFVRDDTDEDLGSVDAAEHPVPRAGEEFLGFGVTGDVATVRHCPDDEVPDYDIIVYIEVLGERV